MRTRRRRPRSRRRSSASSMSSTSISIAWVRGHDQATASPNVPAVASRAMRGACCSAAGVSKTRCTLFCTYVPWFQYMYLVELYHTGTVRVLSCVSFTRKKENGSSRAGLSAIEYVVGLPATSAHMSSQTLGAGSQSPSAGSGVDQRVSACKSPTAAPPPSPTP